MSKPTSLASSNSTLPPQTLSSNPPLPPPSHPQENQKASAVVNSSEASSGQLKDAQNKYHIQLLSPPPPPPPKGLPPQGRSCLVKAAAYDVQVNLKRQQLTPPVANTVEAQLSNIPFHLQEGELFATLVNDCSPSFDEAVTVPAHCAKFDDKLESIQDLTMMLQTLRFWISSALPDRLVEYVIYNNKTNPLIVVHLRSFVEELPQLVPLLEVLESRSIEGRMERAIELGHLPILQQLHSWKQAQNQQREDPSPPMPLTNRLGLPVHPIMRVFFHMAPDLCEVAARHNHLDCLRFLHEQGYEWDKNTCIAALKNRNERCLRYAMQFGCPVPMLCSQFCTDLVKESFFECLVLALQRGCSVDAGTSATAAAGDVKFLQLLHAQGCPRTVACATAAAQKGNIASLEFIYSTAGPWDKTCTAAAAAGDHLEALEFAHSNGCPWDHSCTSAAAESGSLRCLEYAVREGCILDAAVLVRAVRKGSIACLRYLRSLGLPWTEAVTRAAADESNPHHRANNFACLKYAIECGCPHDRRAFLVYQSRCGEKN